MGIDRHSETGSQSGGEELAVIDITEEAKRSAYFDGHENVWHAEDPTCGLSAYIAVHDSTLGPGLGGTRFAVYENEQAAIDDVLRLSRGMTFKAAIAGLPLGGGKAVIALKSMENKTDELLSAYAGMLRQVRGRYVTAEDVGMTMADADFLRERTDNVTGTSIGGSGNPAPFTARGVFLGIQAASRFQSGSESLSGLRVAVQGLGSVGFELCRKLTDAGAQLIVTDISDETVARAREELSAISVGVDGIYDAEADIFAPCALGAVINDETVQRLKATIVAGSANNVLARHEHAAALKDRGILYAPDYVINAGGLINVAAEVEPGGYDRRRVEAAIDRIPDTLRAIFERAKESDLPTNDVAMSMALERIRAAKKA